MTYQVLARKWRPRTFERVVGQAATLKALSQALEQQRLHHAYLFTGTRGVGKTTLARILAKCLNCETGISAHPCGVCATCVEIDNGHYPDLIEVDAASRSKVEETRELLDNVIYAPMRGKYKVYLIDEVHMLSSHSFNALLKTLEEPPAHAVFLLATTDPQRLPITVISRCLQFSLTPITPELIAQQLTYIVQQEQAQAEPKALMEVAHAAAGSMRDALSMLDQLLAYSSGKLTLADVRAVLGTPFPEQVLQLLQALAEGNGLSIVKQIANLVQQLPDLTALLISIIDHLQQIALVQLVNVEANAEIKTLAQHWSKAEVQTLYQIALNGRRDLPYAASVKSGIEMILLRMLASLSAENKKIVEEQPLSTGKTPVTIKEQPAVENEKVSDWQPLLEKLNLNGMTKALAEHCVLLSTDEENLQLALAPQHAALLNKQQQQRIQQALDQYDSQFGAKTRKLQILIQDLDTITPAQQREALQTARHQQAMKAALADPGVQAIVETFDATITVDTKS